MSSLPGPKTLTLRAVPMPSDINHLGNIFGGWIMSQVDLCGGLEAKKTARGNVATVSVDSFVFKHPIRLGDVVSFWAQTVSVGTTSVKVAVEVYASQAFGDNACDAPEIKVTEALLTYVAVDKEGKKRPIPKGSTAQ